MTNDEEALKKAIVDIDWDHEVDLALYKLCPLKIPDYPDYVYPAELKLPASSRHTVVKTGFDSYGELKTFEIKPPEYTKTEDNCNHDCCDEFLEGYICLKCGKWFTYEEDITGKYKKRLQEKLERYKKSKKEWKEMYDRLT